ASQEVVRLSDVVSSSIYRQRKCLEPCRRLSFIEEQLVQAEQDRAAVDSSGKRNTDRRQRILGGEPPPPLVINGLAVLEAGEIEILGQCGTRGIEEALMHRIGIRASDQTQSRDVMRGNHARVTGVKLVSPSTALELCGDFVDALGHNQYRPVGGLRQKISQRTVETSRQHDTLAVLRYEGKR